MKLQDSMKKKLEEDENLLKLKARLAERKEQRMKLTKEMEIKPSRASDSRTKSLMR